jgi:hypothetical protein
MTHRERECGHTLCIMGSIVSRRMGREKQGPSLEERGFLLPFPWEHPTVGWRIPTWMPDWVHSPHWFDLKGRDLSTLASLEFSELDANFAFDVRWNNDCLVAARFALGRRHPMISSVPNAERLQPFPDCAFKRYSDVEYQ